VRTCRNSHFLLSPLNFTQELSSPWRTDREIINQKIAYSGNIGHFTAHAQKRPSVNLRLKIWLQIWVHRARCHQGREIYSFWWTCKATFGHVFTAHAQKTAIYLRPVENLTPDLSSLCPISCMTWNFGNYICSGQFKLNRLLRIRKTVIFCTSGQIFHWKFEILVVRLIFDYEIW